MTFLIRSTFWLMIVFNSMTWTDSAQTTRSVAVDLGRTAAVMLKGATQKAEVEARGACLDNPGNCLDTLAKVSRLGADRKAEIKLGAPTPSSNVSSVDTLRDSDRQPAHRGKLIPLRG